MPIRYLAALLILLSLPACRDTGPPPEPPLRPVRSREVQTASGYVERAFSGIAKAGQESRLSFRVPGAVEQVAVKVGDRVKAGQLIARLDATDYELQKQEAEAALAKARAQARNAEANYARVRALYENRNASRNDLDAARAASESATAAVQASETRLELALSQLRYTRLTAPANGAIASVPVEQGENVPSGKTVAVLTAGAMPEVNVAVPESLIAGIERGSKVSVRLDALPERTFNARVTEVGVAATTYATTYPVTVRLMRDDSAIRPGMAAEVTFRFRQRTDGDNRFVVPPEAVGEDRKGRFVYIVEADENDLGTVHRRTVRVGELTVEGLEIVGGLQNGDRIVTAGVPLIQDGQQVKLLEKGVSAP
ncbi:MAG: rane fusion protein multidrug efflux system [Desulfuromonadales bacterium]|nr:rane fusion protein multidrug efflux system [Desulfuromonadales bacterium]